MQQRCQWYHRHSGHQNVRPIETPLQLHQDQSNGFSCALRCAKATAIATIRRFSAEVRSANDPAPQQSAGLLHLPAGVESAPCKRPQIPRFANLEQWGIVDQSGWNLPRKVAVMLRNSSPELLQHAKWTETISKSSA